MSVTFTNTNLSAVNSLLNKAGRGDENKQNPVRQQGVDGDLQAPGTAAGISNVVRHMTGVQILQASAEVSIKAGEKAQALVFRSAIDRINDMLQPEFGPDALQTAAASGMDFSPEGTAGRILAMSTGFFEGYVAQNQGKERNQLAEDFVALIRGGFEKGFNEAKDILAGLNALQGGIGESIQQTYDLVQKGYDDFLASITAK
ncbi:MAG: DUF5610 domain-containing protein [Betaproteobacteria bacterium]|nr:DUF5610 domain-containing protein [Betaproteobacteria bacterium]